MLLRKLDTYTKLAAAAGFTAVSEKLLGIGDPDAVAAALVELGLREISAEEYALWCEFLPTSYFSHPNLAPPQTFPSSLQYYGFDNPPAVALRRIAQIRKISPVLEVRTPEVKQPDPVVFTHVVYPSGKRRVFMVARWAESLSELIASVDDLKTVLCARRGRTFGMPWLVPIPADGVVWSFIFLLFAGGFLGGMTQELGGNPLWAFYWPLAFAAFWGATAVIRTLDRFKFKRSNPKLARFV